MIQYFQGIETEHWTFLYKAKSESGPTVDIEYYLVRNGLIDVGETRDLISKML